MLKINAKDLIDIRNDIKNGKLKEDFENGIIRVTNYFSNQDNLLKDIPNVSIEFVYTINANKLKDQATANGFIVENISDTIINISLPVVTDAPVEVKEVVVEQPTIHVTVSSETKPAPFMHGDLMSLGAPF